MWKEACETMGWMNTGEVDEKKLVHKHLIHVVATT